MLKKMQSSHQHLFYPDLKFRRLKEKNLFKDLNHGVCMSMPVGTCNLFAKMGWECGGKRECPEVRGKVGAVTLQSQGKVERWRAGEMWAFLWKGAHRALTTPNVILMITLSSVFCYPYNTDQGTQRRLVFFQIFFFLLLKGQYVQQQVFMSWGMIMAFKIICLEDEEDGGRPCPL